MLILGATNAAISISRPNPGLRASSPRKAMLSATSTVPKITITAFEKLGSFFSLIKAGIPKIKQ
jgi:hypothetical protein